MDISTTEVIIIAGFLFASFMAYVGLPALIILWDRMLDHVESSGNRRTSAPREMNVNIPLHKE